MICNKLNAKSVVLLQEYMQRDTYTTHQLHIIDDTQLIQLFGIMKFCLVYSLPHL